MVIYTDYKGFDISNYHMIVTTTTLYLDVLY